MSDYTTLPTYIIDDVQAAIENSDSEIAALRAENDRLKAENMKLREVMSEGILQLEYIHTKFKETGSGNAVLSRLKSALKGEG